MSINTTKTFRIPFKRTVWGEFWIEADTKEEAIKKFENDDYDINDNKSEEEFDIKNIECD